VSNNELSLDVHNGPDQFESLAQAYEASFTEMPFRRYVEVHTLWQVVGPVSGRRFIDIGCGSGGYTREAGRRGAGPLFGVDTSTGMLDHARRMEQQQPVGARYLQRDVTRYQGPGDRDIDHRCDLALSIYVLPYARTSDDLTAMCAFARGCLVRGGRFVAMVMNPDFDRTPGYYLPYGFDLSTAVPAGEPLHNGDEVHLNAEIDDHTFAVTAYFWSRDRHERALRTAGFTGLTWHHPVCSYDIDTRGDPHQLRGYVACPHAMLIEAVAA
jgi:SAM-dependent methyltransferase